MDQPLYYLSSTNQRFASTRKLDLNFGEIYEALIVLLVLHRAYRGHVGVVPNALI